MLVKISFFLFVAVDLGSSQDDNWWYDMGGWDTQPSIQANPYRQTYQHLQRQMNWFGFAKHVGKINRGQLINPELNRPRDRAYGYQSDFNDEDFQLGAFRNPSKGQRIRATQDLVDRGQAHNVGDIGVLPVGVYVQPDGTILVQTSSKRKNPCNPNPCSKVRLSQCDIVNGVTAKCSQHGNYELAFRWSYPENHDITFYLGPAYHDGTSCPISPSYLAYGATACGAIGGPDSWTSYGSGVTMAEETFELTQLEDDEAGLDSKYQDFTYQVYVSSSDSHISKGELVVSYEGEVKQILKIPQYANGKEYYLFGCFRPYYGGYYLDTRGAGFYDWDDVIIGDYTFNTHSPRNYELCNALRWL